MFKGIVKYILETYQSEKMDHSIFWGLVYLNCALGLSLLLKLLGGTIAPFRYVGF